MFLQPDWFDVTKPGVGTNRFSYSFNDPINRFDQGGNMSVYKDQDGDGWNEYYGEIKPGEAGYDDDFSESGISPSEWVDYNNASKSESATVSMGGPIHLEARFGQPVNAWGQANPSFIAKYSLLGQILADPAFYAFALERLQAGNYMNYNQSWEMTGHIYVSKSGIRYDPLPKHATAQRDSSGIEPPKPRKGETSIMFHTHPGSFSRPSVGPGSDTGAAATFSRTVRGASNLGLIATARGIIWAHDDRGFR